MDRPNEAAERDSRLPPDPGEMPPPDAFKAAFHSAAELREYAGYFVATKIDGAKARVRRLIILAAFAVIALLALAAVAITGIVLLCQGLAHLLADAFGGRVWAGYLAAGAMLIVAIAGALWGTMAYLSNVARRRMMHKYELRRTRQRSDFGHDVAQRARQPESR
jgi:hypothetical protein